MTFDGVKVVIIRQRGDDSIRAVIGEGDYTFVAWSHAKNEYNKHPERWERVDAPTRKYGHEGMSPVEAEKWAHLLLISVRVMKYLHEEGLKYDKVVARRNRA
jgi:hypothetical protein